MDATLTHLNNDDVARSPTRLPAKYRLALRGSVRVVMPANNDQLARHRGQSEMPASLESLVSWLATVGR